MWKHFLIWLLILIFTPLALPALLSPQTMSLYIRNDYNAAIRVFGENEWINSRLVVLYKKNLSSIALIANEFKDNHDDSQKFRQSGDHIGEAIADIPSNWSASVKLQAYSLALRTVILSRWAVWLLIPIAMGVIAGVFERKLKSDTFSPPIPPIYNTATHMVLGLLCFLVLWLICPIPISLFIIPTISALISICIGLGIAHYPTY